MTAPLHLPALSDADVRKLAATPHSHLQLTALRELHNRPRAPGLTPTEMLRAERPFLLSLFGEGDEVTRLLFSAEGDLVRVFESSRDAVLRYMRRYGVLPVDVLTLSRILDCFNKPSAHRQFFAAREQGE